MAALRIASSPMSLRIKSSVIAGTSVDIVSRVLDRRRDVNGCARRPTVGWRPTDRKNGDVVGLGRAAGKSFDVQLDGVHHGFRRGVDRRFELRLEPLAG